MVGASRIGGDLWEAGELPSFLLLLAALNFFVGVFNLLPLLPLDGGHIAIAWFERARSWLYVRLGKPDPGRVDYYKLMPVTYVVILHLRRVHPADPRRGHRQPNPAAAIGQPEAWHEQELVEP